MRDYHPKLHKLKKETACSKKGYRYKCSKKGYRYKCSKKGYRYKCT